MTLAPVAERLAIEQSLLSLRLTSVAAEIQTPNLPLAGRTPRSLRRCTRKNMLAITSNFLILDNILDRNNITSPLNAYIFSKFVFH